MAGRARRHLGYLRIDPLKVDVGKVADVDECAAMPSATGSCRCR
jgi:hypothetical protein